jgi:hypothetical protein
MISPATLVVTLLNMCSSSVEAFSVQEGFPGPGRL